MFRPPRKRLARTIRVKASQVSNIEVLLLDIRVKLGAQWTFYVDFIEGVLRSAERSESTAGWFRHIQPLVEQRSDIQFSHQGVVFCLAEKGVGARGEGESERFKTTSPSTLTPESATSHTTNRNDGKMGPPPPPLHLSLPSPPISQDEMEREFQARQPPRPTPITTLTSGSFLPRINLPQTIPTGSPNVAFYGEARSRRATMSKHIKSAPTKEEPVLFSDPEFKDDIYTFFGYIPKPSRKKRGRYYTEARPPYRAADNDLAWWKELVNEGEIGCEEKAVKKDDAKLPPYRQVDNDHKL